MRKLVAWSVLFAVAAAAPAWASFTGGAFRWAPGGAGSSPAVDLYAHTQVKLQTIGGGASGGPFNVELVGNGDGQVPFYPGSIGDFLFRTWCIESQINFTPNVAYWISVDKRAYSGGVAGVAGDPISDVTEWIYDQWNAGNLNAYTNNQISRAIWWAEGEATGQKNAVADAALLALGYNVPAPGPLALASHTWALNLWTGFQQVNGVWYANDVQSHLITVPVPAALLLGVAGLGLVMRRTRI
ncbi:MAG: hypothetical protein IPM18_05370 [Phycisphaerales bacterium]|nr:hypothetical protein [Phycisphaerales bacterium]